MVVKQPANKRKIQLNPSQDKSSGNIEYVTFWQNTAFRKAILAFLTMALAFFILLVALVVYVDPFFHYHRPIAGFPYLVDNQLSQNPGMAEHMEYDSVILGSSMTVNFQTTWFKELMDLNTVKLSYSSAFPKDQANIMDVIFKSDNQVKKVFLGIDVITYTGGVEETKYPLPEYLYDDNVLNDIQYVLNKDVILNYILRPIADPEPTDLSNVYASWWTQEYYSEEWVLHNYTAPAAVAEETPVDEYALAAEKNLSANICPYIEANPETEFVIFFPPYSILFWNDVQLENHLDATLEEYRYIANRLNAYDNVEVYFFPDREEIICDLNHYADYSHYHPDFNRYMAECFANKTNRVAKDGQTGMAEESEINSTDAKQNSTDTKEDEKSIDEYLQHMRELAVNFDYQSLLDRK